MPKKKKVQWGKKKKKKSVIFNGEEGMLSTDPAEEGVGEAARANTLRQSVSGTVRRLGWWDERGSRGGEVRGKGPAVAKDPVGLGLFF